MTKKKQTPSVVFKRIRLYFFFLYPTESNRVTWSKFYSYFFDKLFLYFKRLIGFKLSEYRFLYAVRHIMVETLLSMLSSAPELETQNKWNISDVTDKPFNFFFYVSKNQVVPLFTWKSVILIRNLQPPIKLNGLSQIRHLYPSKWIFNRNSWMKFEKRRTF